MDENNRNSSLKIFAYLPAMDPLLHFVEELNQSVFFPNKTDISISIRTLHVLLLMESQLTDIRYHRNYKVHISQLTV